MAGQALLQPAGEHTPRNSVPGRSLLVTNRKLHVLLRGITTGGSSVFYCGTAFDPPFEMLESYGIDIRKEIEELKGITSPPPRPA